MHEQGQVHVRSAAAVRTRGLLPGAAVQAASRRCAAVHHAVAVGARGDRGPAERDHEWAWGAAGPLRRGDPEQRGDHNGPVLSLRDADLQTCPRSTAPPRRGHRADARVRRAVPGGMTGLALGRPRRLPWARPLPPHAGEGRLSRDSASAGRGGIQIALRRRPCGRRSSWRYLHGSHVRDGRFCSSAARAPRCMTRSLGPGLTGTGPTNRPLPDLKQRPTRPRRTSTDAPRRPASVASPQRCQQPPLPQPPQRP